MSAIDDAVAAVLAAERSFKNAPDTVPEVVPEVVRGLVRGLVSTRNSTETKALTLLGQGIKPEIVASACGVSISRISQLLSDEQFMAELCELRYGYLQKHNERDDKYDTLEDKLLKQFESMSNTLFDPMKILKAIQVLNAAKRRGASAPEQVVSQSTVVNLLMPMSIIQKFTTNINNQVINAGEQTLQTIQSHTLLDAARKKAESLPVTPVVE